MLETFYKSEICIIVLLFIFFPLYFPGVERKRDTTGFGSQPPSKRSRIGSPAETVGGTSLEVDPVDLVYNVLNALDTHNSDKLVSLIINPMTFPFERL